MPSIYRLPGRRLALAVAITAATAAAIGFWLPTATADTAASAAPPPPSVGVTLLKAQDVRTWASFSGRLTPVASADIKPLVGGTIQQVDFSDGQIVSRGQALFLIDPRPHQASLAQAQAQLQAAESRATLTRGELNRAQRLLGDKLISQSLFDAAQNDARIASAQVAEAQAALQQAELNVEYAHITAPVTGRISRAELTEGNVVEAGPNAPVLASIVANDRLYAEFNVDEQTYVRFVRNTADTEDMPVELVLDADASVIYEGHIHAFDNRLDTASGTIRARAIVDNTDGALTPGMYARVRLGSPDTSRVLLIPERAIGTNQDKKFVLVVDENNTARYREVTFGDRWQNLRIVTSGLTAGERIIVNGLSHVRPDTPVTPVEADALAAAH